MASTKAQVPAGSRFPVASLLLALAASVAVAVLVLGASHIPGLLRLEYSSADLRTALFSQRVTADHPRVAVVAISDETLRTFATKSPIDRGFLAQLVAAIDKAGAHAIGLDVFMLRPTESSKDTALHNALRDAKAQIVMGVLDERDRAAAGQRAYQAEFVAGTGRPTGYLALRYERDGVVRNVAGPARNSAFPDSFSLQLARSIKPDSQQPYGRIAWLQKVDPKAWYSGLVTIDGKLPFAVVRAEDVIDPSKSEERRKLAGKIVLVGADYAYADRHRTPLTAWSGNDMPGVAIHAMLVAQIIDGRTVKELDTGRARLLTLALACLGGLLGWRFRHRKFDFLGWSIAAAVLIGVDALIFSSLHFVLPFMLSMLAWFSGVTAGHNFGLVYDWEIERARDRRDR